MVFTFAEKNYGDVAFWHERGINTYMQQNSGAVVPNSLENEYEDILNRGIIFNVQDKANQIVEDMKTEIIIGH
ncbi:vitamin B12 ABC transporter B12-binding component BtuF [Fusibacter sp. 3D3]|nr:vitamin B12 ABC transporter B12-binding component BtuF [Fusibacter sp. 3D3]